MGLSEAAFVIDAALYNATGLLLVALGLLITVRFLGYPDLTADGSFTVGAGTFATLYATGYWTAGALFAAFLAGCCAGALTAGLNQGLGLGRIMSGVIVMLALITAIPYTTGGSTIGLLGSSHSFDRLHAWDRTLTRRLWPEAEFSLHLGYLLLFTLAIGPVVAACVIAFRSRVGVEVRYLGSAVSSNLLRPSRRVGLSVLALACGNGLIGLGGAVESMRRGGFSQNMGFGILLIGLTCLILGESVLKARLRRDNLYVGEAVAASLGGVALYSFALQFLLEAGLTFLDIRLTTTLFLLVLLALAARFHPNTARLF